MRYCRLLALILMMTTFAPPTGAQSAPPPLPTVAFEKTTLPNGLIGLGTRVKAALKTFSGAKK